MEDIAESRARQGTIDFRSPLARQQHYQFIGMSQEDGLVYIKYNGRTIYRCTAYLGEIQAEAADYYDLSCQSLKPDWLSIEDTAQSSKEAATKIIRYLAGNFRNEIQPARIAKKPPWYKRIWGFFFK